MSKTYWAPSPAFLFRPLLWRLLRQFIDASDIPITWEAVSFNTNVFRVLRKLIKAQFGIAYEDMEVSHFEDLIMHLIEPRNQKSFLVELRKAEAVAAQQPTPKPKSPKRTAKSAKVLAAK